ncbi:MAG TPA: cytochrome b5-like heme/steroid binding domain-containing protein [Candidatus Binatia bacterium]|nr:cytochrome b5-like heme/steroid binding domain-containing protein [Candidatus Binatia bacterium]
MKWIVAAASAMFWLAMTAIWSFAGWAPELAPETAKTVAAAAEAPQYTSTDVAAHGSAAGCWVIIDGQVYDLTGYIDVHPANPTTILQYCGKDGTRGWETKGRNRPHSAEAQRLLERYLIGTVSDD